MILLLALPCAYGIKRSPPLGLPLAADSVLPTPLLTLSDVSAPVLQRPNPLFDGNKPLSATQQFSPALGMALNQLPSTSLAVLYTVLMGRFVLELATRGSQEFDSRTP